ncbi:MAG: hypothetical protein V2I40_02335 [Desulfobacteraceae bacterium]|jgi:hypothetical protein|nr:hypothetical protein [Desulfobacteraceae bacterium]
MMDQHRSSIPENQEPYPSSSPSNQNAAHDIEKRNCPAGQVDIIAMVRSLQRTAGVADCFRMGNADCDMIDCDWRTYCLGAPADPKKKGKPTRLK